MKVGIIGLGYWGPNLLRNLAIQENCSIVAYDRDIKQINKLEKQYPQVVFAKSIDEVLCDEAIEGVVIATPPRTHYDLACSVLDKGKHVFVEKPLTLDSTEAEALVSKAAAMKKILMVGHTFLFVPEVREIKRLLDEGIIGKLLHIESNRKNLGKFQSCGVVWDLAPHDIALLYYFTGLAPDDFNHHTELFSHISSDVADAAVITMTSKKDSLSYQLNLSWLHPVKERSTYFVGEQGMLIYDMMAKNKVVLVERRVESCNGEFRHIEGVSTTIPIDDTEEPLYKEMREFLATIKSGKTDCLSDGQLGLDVVKTIESM